MDQFIEKPMERGQYPLKGYWPEPATRLVKTGQLTGEGRLKGLFCTDERVLIWEIMPLRAPAQFPNPDSAEQRFSGRHFDDERKDNIAYNGLTFEFCTFKKIGIRSTVFEHCTFRHCEFLDCYMVGARFEHCNFLGSTFERCNFSWAEFPNSQLDYTRFYQCAPVLIQVLDHKPKDPQAAAKFFRNLAYEQKISGNWQEVDRLIQQSYRERERHYWFAVNGQNDHYLHRDGGVTRVRYLVRFLFSKANGFIWGYRVSWRAFGRSLILFWLLFLPIINAVFGKAATQAFDYATIDGFFDYLLALYKTTTQSFLPFVAVPTAADSAPGLIIPFPLVTIESLFGTLFIALFASLLFRSASKGL